MRLPIFTYVLFASSTIPALALAQAAGVPASAPTATLGEVVVTAQKRSENVQRVPLAVTAVGGDTLANRQVTSIEQLSSVSPSLVVGQFGGVARIAIRGLGFDTINPGSEGRVAYHLDGVYISRPSAQLGTFFDVDRVEVLRGPQGTLYGRNTTGGSINVISNGPTDAPSGYIDLTGGNYNTIAVNAALSGPITDNLDARIAVATNSHSGYGKDTYTGEGIDDANTRGVRGIIRYRPTNELSWTVSADYYAENDHNGGIHYLGEGVPGQPISGVLLGGVVATNIRDITSPYQPENNHSQYGVSSVLQYDFDGMTFRSVTAYRGSKYTVHTDLDQTNLGLAPFDFYESAHQVSQEFQLLGQFGRSKWIAGAYFFDENIFEGSHIPLNLELFGGPNLLMDGYNVPGHTHTTAAAVFGQLDLALTDRLTFTLGGRYNHETIGIHDQSQFDLTRPFNPGDPIVNLPGFPRAASTTDNAFTPKVGLEFQFTPAIMGYVSASEGYKSGGFDVGVSGPAFKPETVWDYEGGVKATTFDGHLRTNLAGFYYDYSNLQVQQVNFATVFTQNASATLYGLELEFTAIPISTFQVDGAFDYMHSEYNDFHFVDPLDPPGSPPRNLHGYQLIQAPTYSLNLGAQYRWDLTGGNLTLRVEMNYVSRVYYTADDNPAVSTPDNAKFNAFLTYQRDGGHWTASLYCRNLLDKTTIANALLGSVAVGYPALGVLAPPRTFGVKIGYKF